VSLTLTEVEGLFFWNGDPDSGAAPTRVVIDFGWNVNEPTEAHSVFEMNPYSSNLTPITHTVPFLQPDGSVVMGGR
jgi:hypothetical protein